MKSKLTGLHSTHFRLADGTLRIYYYAWKGGPAIVGKDGKRLYDPDTPEFRAAFDAARAPKPVDTKVTTIQNLIDQFRGTAGHTAWTEFTKLSGSSQRNYKIQLRKIEAKFGTLPVAALVNPKMRGIFKAWRDKMGETPRSADYAWMVLSRLFNLALDRGLIEKNPCERGGRLYESDRIDKIWTEADLQKLFAVCSAEVFDAVMLALWTGQRQGDLLRLSWNAQDGKSIRLAQGKSKGKRRVTIPIGPTLAAHLANIPRRSTQILTSSLGKPWTSDGFRTSFGRACEEAEINDLTFHDLRGTAVTRLALADCSPPEIATITGHSLKDVTIILDRHYLSRDVRLAEQAVAKLERTNRGDLLLQRPKTKVSNQ